LPSPADPTVRRPASAPIKDRSRQRAHQSCGETRRARHKQRAQACAKVPCRGLGVGRLRVKRLARGEHRFSCNAQDQRLAQLPMKSVTTSGGSADQELGDPGHPRHRRCSAATTGSFRGKWRNRLPRADASALSGARRGPPPCPASGSSKGIELLGNRRRG
jgi:hypothetical protein